MENFTNDNMTVLINIIDMKVFLSFLSTVASLCTICGNALVLLSFYVEKKLRTASNYLIASLAITDVIIGLVSMNMFTVYLLLGYWPLGIVVCDIWLSIDYSVCLVSQYTVLTITVDRFCSVKLPALYHNWKTETKMSIIIVLIWLIPSSIFFTIIIGWEKVSGQKSIRLKDECFAEFSSNPLFNVIFTICYFWVTLFVMIGLYFGIYFVALKLQNKSERKQKLISKYLEESQNTLEKEDNNITYDIRNNVFKKSNSPFRENGDIDILYSRKASLNSSIFHSTFNSLQSSFESFYTAKMLPIEICLVTSNSDKNLTNSEKNSMKNFNDYNTVLHQHPLKKYSLKTTSNKNLPTIIQSEYQSNTPQSSLKLKNKCQNPQGVDPIIKCTSNKLSHSKLSKSIKAKKALRTITLILGAFVLTWTPYHILILIKSYCDDPIKKYSCINETLYNFSYWLCYLNSPINPFCYAFVNQQFKITFQKLLHLNK